jgi:hypothetical protein|tara:strand:+ start:57 stop:287 length:231 start_codon:yes stop_codon:yes gene_type:complete
MFDEWTDRDEELFQEFNQFLKDLMYGINQKKMGIWTEGDRLQHLVLIFSRHGLTKDAKYYEEEYYKWEKNNKGENK